MATATQTGFSKEAFESFLAERNEPEWLSSARRAAWQAFEDLPMPSRADEEWMRTDIRLFRLDKFHLPSADASADSLASQSTPHAPLLSHGVDLGGRTASVDSRGMHAELTPKWAKQGVLFGSLDELVRTHG